MKLKQWQNISCDFKWKFSSATCNSNQKWNNKTCHCECKKDYSWNHSTYICENSTYLECIADNSVIECDKIITVMGIVSTKKANTIATNVTSTSSINCLCNKVRDCYILHAILLVIKLLLIIAIICYYYAKHRSKLKNTLPLQQYKMENSEFKKIRIKKCTCYYLDEITKLVDFDLGNISINQKSQ